MRILYFGTSTFALPALQALVDHDQVIVGVVTQPDRPAGRGGVLTPPPIKTLAVSCGLPVLQPESCRDAAFIKMAHTLAPELIVVAAYGQFLPDRLLHIPPKGAVNLHSSLLPKFRGAAPMQRAIMAGETRTGVCLMWMVREMDAGDVVDCRETPIKPEDTGGTLSARLASLGAELLLAWLPALEAGTAPHHPQDSAQVTFAPPIRKEDRPLDWRRPTEQLWWQIRALAPAPGATTIFRGQPLKVLSAQPEVTSLPGEPGMILAVSAVDGPLVATGSGALRLLSVHPAGKRAMDGAEFTRGARLHTGERFGE